MHKIANILITWYLKNKRDLPWRKTTDPYRVWLSEIMLQQTRVAQGKPYYLKFIKAFSTVFELADASEEQVLKLWQGLGYYSRARNLHATAKFVAYELDGKFPTNYKDLKKLKGVGDYTASAIASICYKEPKAVVDGNVFRVLSRLYGIATPINTTEGEKLFNKLAQDLIDLKQPDIYNQAIMEFGAMHCTPKKPLCASCVFLDKCDALKTKKTTELPVKLKKIKVRNRYFNYIVPISNATSSILNKRSKKGIWANLYEFPLLESEHAINTSQVIELLKSEKLFSESFELSLYNEKPVVHKLSHQHLYVHFWIVTTQEQFDNAIPLSELEKYPVPVLIANFIKEFSF